MVASLRERSAHFRGWIVHFGICLLAGAGLVAALAPMGASASAARQRRRRNPFSPSPRTTRPATIRAAPSPAGGNTVVTVRVTNARERGYDGGSDAAPTRLTQRGALPLVSEVGRTRSAPVRSQTRKPADLRSRN